MPYKSPEDRRRRQSEYSKTLSGRASILTKDAKYRAKKAGLCFDVDSAWILKKLDLGFCEMTGLAFTYEAPRKGYMRNPYSPSIERHDNSLGYTKKNTKVVIWAYNQAKGQWNDKHFKRIIYAIHRRMEWESHT